MSEVLAGCCVSAPISTDSRDMTLSVASGRSTRRVRVHCSCHHDPRPLLCNSIACSMSGRSEQSPPQHLTVASFERDGRRVVALAGELDLASAPLAEEALQDGVDV